MAEWYYTDLWQQRFGPVDDVGLLELNDSGIITGDTNVWKEGFENWLPFKTVAEELFPKTEEGDPPKLGVCAHTGKVVLRNDMVSYGSALIAVESKRDFVQSLMETGRTTIEDATETTVRYIGFWMRLLGVFLDEMIKMVIIILVVFLLFLVLFFIGMAFSQFSPESFFENIGLLPILIILGGAALTIGATAFYEVWMVGKYQATLGKMAIGAKVVAPDESRISYKRALGRWAAKCPIQLELVKYLPYLMLNLSAVLIAAGIASESKVMGVATVFLVLVLPIIIMAAITSVFWMAGVDPEKRALHDRIAGTRVVRK